MRKIVYLREPGELFRALGLDNETGELTKLLSCFDYAGGITLPKQSVEECLDSFPAETASLIARLGNPKNDLVHLRSDMYYLNFTYDDDMSLIRRELPKTIRQMEEAVNRLSEMELHPGIENRLMAASILDHKKHYSMCVLNAFFGHMLQDDFDIELYENAKNVCVSDISNFYRFILTGKIGEQHLLAAEALDAFENSITLPSPRLPSLDNPTSESSARKIIMREMDHPMQIVLFAGQVIDQDGSSPIDLVVNPLCGALEVGYAMQEIYRVAGIQKVNDILLLKYSRHGEQHTIQDSLTPFIPLQLVGELDKVKGRRTVIIDDNTFSGKTLYDLREMFYKYTSNVGIAAIERRTDSDEAREVTFDELDIQPISKLRFIGNVIRFIQSNNLYGIGDYNT